MQEIAGRTFDEERAFYGCRGLHVRNCRFEGPADGESAFKECSDVFAESCFFHLRYPFWHDHGVRIDKCEMTELCRAALWYSEHITVTDTEMHGIKALRECRHVELRHCDIRSPEFGWFSEKVEMRFCTAESEYFMMRARQLTFDDVKLQGKYAFQYITDSVFDHCVFNTKDAFWHAKNVTVKNSVITGEYLAWYCENVTFENCVITGTQPLCYCEGLRLINCELHGADLAFEKSEVEATITNPMISIKNPRSGHICVPSAALILDDTQSACRITMEGQL